MTTEQIKDLTNLLSLTWHGNQKMIEHCLKSSNYIPMGNMFVNCGDAKPTISKTLWYDDTKTGPDADYAAFIRLNERNNMPTLRELTHRHTAKLYFIVNYNCDKSGGRLVSLTYEEDSATPSLIREVTELELEKINCAIKDAQEAYTKRLNAYWKRYGATQFSCEGYWVDR